MHNISFNNVLYNSKILSQTDYFGLVWFPRAAVTSQKFTGENQPGMCMTYTDFIFAIFFL